MSDPAFIIEELAGPRRRLELSGWCLPLADASPSWRGEQRRQVTRYPGSPVATIQVLGPMDSPGSYRFRFDRRRLGGSDDAGRQATYALWSDAAGVRSSVVPEALREPLAVADVLDRVWRSGQEVQVSWGVFVRRGLLASIEVVPRHEALIEVVLGFEWGSRGDEVPASVSPPFDFRMPERSIRQLLADFADQLARPARFVADLLEEANGYVLQVESGVEALTGVLDEYTDLSTAGRDVLGNVVGIAGTIREAAVGLSFALERDLSALCGDDDAGAALAAGAVVNTGQDLARQIAEQAALIRAEVLALFGGDDLLAVEIAPAGATLQQYAAAYYGDPARWPTIASYNGLSSPSLSLGEIVAIPSLSGGA